MPFALIWFVAIVAAVGSLVWLFRSASFIALAVVLGLSVFAFVWAGIFSWLLRDGIGPDSVPSTGLVAWRRFASDMIFRGGISCLIIGIAIGFFLWRNRKMDSVA